MALFLLFIFCAFTVMQTTTRETSFLDSLFSVQKQEELKAITKRYVFPVLAIIGSCLGAYLLMQLSNSLVFSSTSIKQPVIPSQEKNIPSIVQPPIEIEIPAQENQSYNPINIEQPSGIVIEQPQEEQMHVQFELATYARRARDDGSYAEETQQLHNALINYFNTMRDRFTAQEHQWITAWIEQRSYQDLLNYLLTPSE